MVFLPEFPKRIVPSRVEASASLSRFGRISDVLSFGSFTSLYALLIAYFRYFDVYNEHFFDAGYAPLYNFARVLFAGYLFWIVYCSGAAFLERVSRQFLPIRLLHRIAIGFFTGAALWTLLMLPIGYLGLYTWGVAVILTLPIVAASSRHFRRVCLAGADCIRNLTLADVPAMGLALVALVFGGLLLIVKGLYPAGGHDYYTHYLYYLTAVIDRHDIWPNEVWYHYFYQKGMGLFFLGMLLTDPLAPSLVSFGFTVATAIALFSLVSRCGPGTLWPWVAVILYFALYIYTPGTGIYAFEGGWGDFQKPHEVNAGFMLALVWMSVGFLDASGAKSRPWWLATAMNAFAVAYVTTVSSIVVGLFCVLMALGCLMVHRRKSAVAFLGLAIIAGAGLISVLGINFSTTGIPLDNGIELFWPFVDLHRLREWGVLAEVVFLVSGRIALSHQRLALASMEMYDFLQNVCRAEVLTPLLYCTVATGLAWGAARIGVYVRSRCLGALPFWALQAPRIKKSPANAFAPAVAFLGVMFVAAIAVGAAQPISYVRYTSFALPLLIAVATAGCQVMNGSLVAPRWFRVPFAFVVPCVFLYVILGSVGQTYLASFRLVVDNAEGFVTGRFSIYDSYVDQSGWPGPGSGAVRPWDLAVWKQLGRGVRFWTFHVHNYCMLPQCRPEAFMSFRLSPHSFDIILGRPSEARDILQREGLNYFLFETDDRVSDPLPCSELFSPDHIAEYLGIRWSDGTHSLLTWLGPGIEPLTSAWLESYRARVSEYPCADANHMPLLRSVAQQLASDPRWGADLVMPWSKH